MGTGTDRVFAFLPPTHQAEICTTGRNPTGEPPSPPVIFHARKSYTSNVLPIMYVCMRTHSAGNSDSAACRTYRQRLASFYLHRTEIKRVQLCTHKGHGCLQCLHCRQRAGWNTVGRQCSSLFFPLCHKTSCTSETSAWVNPERRPEAGASLPPTPRVQFAAFYPTPSLLLLPRPQTGKEACLLNSPPTF